MESYEERLANLHQQLKYYKELIINQVTAINSSLESSIDLRNDPRNAIPLLQNDVLELIKDAHETSDYFEKNKKELEECESLISVISVVSNVCELTSACNDAVNNGCIQKATALVAELKLKLEMLPKPNSEIGTGVVCTLLRRECQTVISRHKSRTCRLIRNCISIEQGKIHVIKSLKGFLQDEDSMLQEPILLTSLWESVVKMNCSQEVVRSFIIDSWKFILKPLWLERKKQAPRIVRTEEFSEIQFEGIVRESASHDPCVSDAAMTDTASIGKTVASCRMPFPQLLELVASVLNFLWTEVFSANDELSGRFAVALQSPPVSLSSMLTDTLLALLPKTESELTQFQKQLEKPCKEFDSRLISMNLTISFARSVDGQQALPSFTGKSSTSSCLGDIIMAGNTHFAVIQRKELLSRARDVIISDYHNTMLASGDALEDDPSSAGNVGDPRALMEQSGSFALQSLRFESCQISLASCRLLKHVHEILKQACVSSAELATIFYETARDCFELFMAIVPMKFADAIETSPRMGAVFYNDCSYIAHNTTLLSHAYRQELGKCNDKLLGSIGLIDFIPRYRALGEMILSQHVEDQRTRLLDLVSRININTELESQPNTISNSRPSMRRAAGRILAGSLQLAGRMGIEALAGYTGTESGNLATSGTTGTGTGSLVGGAANVTTNDIDGSKLVVRQLELLGQQWKGVLQESIYLRIMAYLIECCLKHAMKPVLEAECVTERAGTDVSNIFRQLQQMSVCLQFDSEDGDATMSTHCSSWKKFCALTDLLEYSLTDVAEWLPRRKFSSFSGAEMTSLIKALFEDSPKRQGILVAIQEMSLS